MPTIIFSLDSFRITETRSLHNDTDFVSVSMTVGNNPAVTQTKAMGDLNNGTYQVGLAVSAEVPTDNTPVVLSYVILNNGHEQTDVQKGVEAALTALGNAGVKAASTAVGAAIGAALGASLGTVAVPLIGTALGALSGWVVTEVGSILFADCDGPVAVGVHVYTGEQLTQGTAAGQKISESDVQHLGNPSPPGCGANSVYFTSDTISALQPTTQTDWQHCSKCAGLFFAGVDAGICPAGGNHSVSAGSNYGLSFSGVGAGSGQPDWKWCNQCQGLFYAGSSLGVCPSHSHNDAGSSQYVVSTSGSGQPGWKWCKKCQNLYYSNALGVCAAGGGHDDTGSGNYDVSTSVGAGQAGWRSCKKCQSLFYAGDNALGLCPAGGAHDDTGSSNYVLPSTGTGQTGWRWCNKCESLFFAGDNNLGVCTSHSHNDVGSSDYLLSTSGSGGQSQPDWRWCNKCQGLFYAGGGASVCPAGGAHDDSGSSNYVMEIVVLE